MSFHDAYLRRTPFELAFADAEGFSDLPGAVAAESRERGTDPRDLDAFLGLECVIGFVRSVRGETRDAALVQYGSLVYHAVHFSGHDRTVLLVPTAQARDLVARAPVGGPPTPPGSSGYVQLPRHLFWMSGASGDHAEPVDGWFWTVSAADQLVVLLVAGVRDDRAGFAAVPLPEAPLGDAALWTNASIRPAGDDFAPTLPGGELGGLHSIESAGEVLKLSARLFVRLAAGGARPGPSSPDVPAGAPAASRLAYTIVET